MDRAPLLSSVAVLTAALALGCSRPNPTPTAPAAPASGPASRPVAPPTASAAPAAPAGAQASEAAFSGELLLGAGLEGKVRDTDVLFVIARQFVEGGAPGMLVAVARHEKVSFPMKFSLGPENVMVQGTPFVGPFLLQVRLDRDGDAMTKGADDLYAQATGPVRGGQADLKLTLTEGPPAPKP